MYRVAMCSRFHFPLPKRKMNNRFNGTGNAETGEITVTPPDSLVKYEAPLFVGIESSNISHHPKGGLNDNTKVDDMINSILPPRYLTAPLYSFILILSAENGQKNRVFGCKMCVGILQPD
jgi:hypothetical protein